MTKPDYDDPGVDERWCDEQRAAVCTYLRSQRVNGRVGEWPAWHVAPYASIWAIESLARPEWIGWWVISGDLPTDYISSADVSPPQHPRKAMMVFAKNWLQVIKAWKDGRELENTRIGDPGSHEDLAPLLESRAKLLMEWVEDDSLWAE
jgi:hypothetical protein